MAQTLAMPLAPSLSVICNGRNPNSLFNSLSFPIASPPKVGRVHLRYCILFFGALGLLLRLPCGEFVGSEMKISKFEYYTATVNMNLIFCLDFHCFFHLIFQISTFFGIKWSFLGSAMLLYLDFLVSLSRKI
jgi:hypothetical protein